MRSMCTLGRTLLVSILFIGSSLHVHLNIFTKKFYPLFLLFFDRFVLLSLMAITLISFALRFIVALGKYLKRVVIMITI